MAGLRDPDTGPAAGRRASKVRSLADALAGVADGATVVLGGAFLHNKPMAAVRELVRRGPRRLTVVAAPAGSLDVDLLVGTGVADRVVSSYVGFEHLGLAPRFRERAQAGEVAIWECDETHLMVAMEAAARGAPSGLTRAGLGTDLPRLNPDLKVVDDPFTGAPVIAVRALEAQWAVLHVQDADPWGNARHAGSPFADRLVAQAVKRQGGRVVVTADRVVPPGSLPPREVTLPHVLVDAVVEVPMGAHPLSSHGRYVHDEAHLRRYLAAARTPEGFRRYVEEVVLGAPGQAAYLERVGGADGLAALSEVERA